MNERKTNKFHGGSGTLAGSQNRIHTGRDEGKGTQEEGKTYVKSQSCDNSVLDQTDSSVAEVEAEGRLEGVWPYCGGLCMSCSGDWTFVDDHNPHTDVEKQCDRTRFSF